MKHFSKLEEFCIQNHLEYNESTDSRFQSFCEHLMERNKVMNLTAITDPTEIEIKHFIDSIEAAPVIIEKMAENDDETEDFKIIDIGTGAGFPGIPLSIVIPNAEFTLADSLEKRINFIHECLTICEIRNISAIHSRAEDLGQGELRETFDICVSRAVAAMPILLEYCLPLVNVGGSVILYKSGSVAEEIDSSENALNILGGKISDIKEFVLPESNIKRSLIIISKTERTPEKYPRKAGKPSKAPL